MSAVIGGSVGPITASDNVSTFVCAVEPALEGFLRHKALILHQRNVCAVYLVRAPAGVLLGYFTLSPTALYQESLNNSQARKFHYNPISAMLLGQFARDTEKSPKGFGAALFKRALATALFTPGWQVLVVDPFSEESAEWFVARGFRQVKQNYPTVSSDQPIVRLRLYMTRQTIEATMRALAP
jgi:hypothetical protein